MFIKVIIIAFIFFALSRTALKYKKNEITGRELLIWAVFWLLVGLAALAPQKTDVLAQWLGVSRGADLLVYLSIIVLFYLVFKIIVRLEKMDREITKVVRKNALDEAEKD